MESIWAFEIEITKFLQGLGTWLQFPMELFTFLGNEEFYMLIMPALYWCVDPILGVRIGVMLVTSGTLNSTAKLLFKSPRPYWVDTQVQAFITESSFGLPSGHAMNSMSVWGLLAASLRKKAKRVIPVLVILLVGISRIYLGVHFTSDVLVGWLMGFLLLLVYLRSEKQITRWVKNISFSRFVVFMFLVALTAILINAGIISANRDWQIPSSWLATIAVTAPHSEIDPLSLDGTITNAAVFFGLVSGAMWFHRKGGFNAGGNWVLRLLRYVLGLAGVLVLWAGLGNVFPDSANLIGYSLRFVRYTLTGLWISAGAPLVFQKLGLLEKVKDQ